MYYTENPEKIYPKREQKSSSLDGQVDDSVNYWLYVPGDDANLWQELFQSEIIGFDWDFLEDLNQYENRLDIQKAISEHRKDKKNSLNEAKEIWDFYREIKPGDIVYAKTNGNHIVGKGVVNGDYYFDSNVSKYKHRHNIDWTNKGSWNLSDQVSQKMLTNLNNYPDFIVYLDQHINGEPIDEKLHLINEFKVWLSQQVQQNGELLNDKTISQKISSLKSIEVTFTVIIFGETDTEALKNIKETVLNDETYDRYKGVSGSSIDYYIRYVESRPSARENESYSREDFLSEVYIDEHALESFNQFYKIRKI